MILQSLNEYYNRKRAESDSDIPGYGWMKKAVRWLIVVTEDGEFVRVEDTMMDKRIRQFVVPMEVTRSIAAVSNLLWDNFEYVIGEDGGEKHRLFVERLSRYADVPSIGSVLKFLSRADMRDSISSCDCAEDMSEKGAISFKVVGSVMPVSYDPVFIERYNADVASADMDAEKCVCMVSGDMDEKTRLHFNVHGVKGAPTTGASLVSYNDDSFCSYGFKQGDNAVIGKHAAFAYATALNHLLEYGSRQKAYVGDTTYAFWTSRPTAMEDEFAGICGDDQDYSPDLFSDSVDLLLKSVESGSKTKLEDDVSFNLLGLGVNAKRLCIRDWETGRLSDFTMRIAKWFSDLELVHGDIVRTHLPFKSLLESVVLMHGKEKKISPVIITETMKAAFGGTPIPLALQEQAVMRERIESSCNPRDPKEKINAIRRSYARVKLLKACINRKTELNNKTKERLLTMALDKENTNCGYLLGRMFAVIEKVNADDVGRDRTTVRSRFYSAASCRPSSVFATLIKLMNHHMAKIENDGIRIRDEKMLGEIMEKLPAELPSVLSLDDQSRFAVGYYHQREDFFNPKASDER